MPTVLHGYTDLYHRRVEVSLNPLPPKSVSKSLIYYRRHVYRDLYPYCYTFEHCTTSDRLYDSRQAWFNHEMEAHRTVWQCVGGCEKTFSSEDNLASHIRTIHPEIVEDNIISTIKQTAVRSVNVMESATCPVCGKHVRLSALQKHLGHHQEQLALFVLPLSLDTTEDDKERDQVSEQIGSFDADRSDVESTDTDSEVNTKAAKERDENHDDDLKRNADDEVSRARQQVEYRNSRTVAEIQIALTQQRMLDKEKELTNREAAMAAAPQTDDAKAKAAEEERKRGVEELENIKKRLMH